MKTLKISLEPITAYDWLAIAIMYVLIVGQAFVAKGWIQWAGWALFVVMLHVMVLDMLFRKRIIQLVDKSTGT